MIHLKLFEVDVMIRSKQQWLELIQAQQTCDLTIVDFGREKNLSLINFYVRLSNWLKYTRTNTNLKPSTFSKVTIAEKSKFSTTAITHSIGKATFSITSSTDVVWLIKLIGVSHENIC
jgi:hypothetical protein